ncbi:SAM-dependent methyltransferase [Niastella caeni]|uniref:SAM-dependent methyltransferase n=1 Tax=Niastella caeni TaxID=2569763 RepID=A0A4S8H922_9BACT|nr:SAM-dependent methyltransferase [Niastella caeni]THU31137.1 SAM-dependent methyltransferase [Niastella caeni]
MTSYTRHPSSFKDPSGYVFEAEGKIYRQVNQYYAAQYRQLMESGLYKQLLSQQRLIPHVEVVENMTNSQEWYTTLLPERLQTISYPYEWCFEQLQDAALLTLTVLKTSLQHGMILKDATPYNIQFHKGRPIFIDTLSFDTYDPKQPWIAYRQFCQCFLFPLYLEHYLKSDIQRILSTYIDGIPVDFIAKLLPLKSRLSLGVWLHVYLQHTTSTSTRAANKHTAAFSKKKLLDVISHLTNIIANFPNNKTYKTTWSNYYEDTILSKDYLQEKDKIVRAFCQNSKARSVLDLGANDGYFSRLFASYQMQVIATDADNRCISRLYQEVKKNNIDNILPLILDIANPSPAIGFNNQERAAFHDRIKTDLVAALALVHHLVIGKNISLPVLADYFNSIAPELIIEFVPKEDEKVQQMLKSRPDTFVDYDQSHFERYFSTHFDIIEQVPVPGTHRILYRMRRKR